MPLFKGTYVLGFFNIEIFQRNKHLSSLGIGKEENTVNIFLAIEWICESTPYYLTLHLAEKGLSSVKCIYLISVEGSSDFRHTHMCTFWSFDGINTYRTLGS